MRSDIDLGDTLIDLKDSEINHVVNHMQLVKSILHHSLNLQSLYKVFIWQWEKS